MACIACFATNLPLARASAFTYAQIKQKTPLFSEQGDILFLLPDTYFVMIIGQERNGKLPVFYDDIEGFVDVNAVEVVDYEPKYKYHSASLTFLNDGHKINIRSKPSHLAGDILLQVDSDEVAEFLGSVEGSAQVTALGNLWHYCRVRKKGESVVGFVYSLYAQVDDISPNVIEKVEPPAVENTPTQDALSSPSDPLREVVIILSLCLPALVGIYLIFRKQP